MTVHGTIIDINTKSVKDYPDKRGSIKQPINVYYPHPGGDYLYEPVTGVFSYVGAGNGDHFGEVRDVFLDGAPITDVEGVIYTDPASGGINVTDAATTIYLACKATTESIIIKPLDTQLKNTDNASYISVIGYRDEADLTTGQESFVGGARDIVVRSIPTKGNISTLSRLKLEIKNDTEILTASLETTQPKEETIEN